MARKQKLTFESVTRQLEALEFQLTTLEGERVLARKNGCAAILGPARELGAEVLVRPGRVVKGELSRLVDRGYQKFLKTADVEVPALPEDLRALASFQRELRFALGLPVLYNESLGSVSDRYLYDRLWFRDEGRQPKPWEAEAAVALREL